MRIRLRSVLQKGNLLCLATALMLSQRAVAEPCGDQRNPYSTCVDVDPLWSRPGNSPWLSMPGATTLKAGDLSTSFTLSYLKEPFVLQADGPSPEGREIAVVDNLLNGTFSLGLGVTDRLEVGIAGPITFYEDGAGYGSINGSGSTLTRSVLRDPRLSVLLALLERDRVATAEGLSVVARFELGVPLGSRPSFATSGTATFAPAVLANYRVGPFEAELDVGARLRGEVGLPGVNVGSQMSVGLGATLTAYDPLGLAFSAEAFALPSLVAPPEGFDVHVPAEWLASARLAPFFRGDLFFQLGGGTALPLSGSNVTSPAFRGTFSLGYSPLGHDADRDGIRDRDDRCELEPEDRDGFEDSDGCVDPDNDKDGVADSNDRCRDSAETVDGFEDTDGCPDLDDDKDDVIDEEDECRNAPEDKDGFSDGDGCPDPDNDGDRVADEFDLCPLVPEDPDGTADNDGCPDADDDGDGVADEADQCRTKKEDPDGFADGDGCPDPDNDNDGILDSADRCTTEAETLDGNADNDGCPEPGATSVARVGADGRIAFTSNPRFDEGKAERSPALTQAVRVATSLLGGQTKETVLVVTVSADRPGQAALATRRASLLRKLFQEAGANLDAINITTAEEPGAAIEWTFIR